MKTVRTRVGTLHALYCLDHLCVLGLHSVTDSMSHNLIDLVQFFFPVEL